MDTSNVASCSTKYCVNSLFQTNAAPVSQASPQQGHNKDTTGHMERQTQHGMDKEQNGQKFRPAAVKDLQRLLMSKATGGEGIGARVYQD
jgi:hypothetical protein